MNLPKCCYAMPLGHISCSRQLDGTGLLTGQPTNSNASSKKIQKDPKRRFQLGCGPCQIVLPGQMSQGLQALLVSEALGQAHLRHLTPQRYTIMFALFASPLFQKKHTTALTAPSKYSVSRVSGKHSGQSFGSSRSPMLIRKWWENSSSADLMASNMFK